MSARLLICAAGMAATWSSLPGSGATAQGDRAIVWTTAAGATLERELNRHAARGLVVAAVSDGLPCTVTAMQAPERTEAPAAYRVVADRDLDARLGALREDGFVPRLAHRAMAGRAHVIFERRGVKPPAAAWRAIEFPALDDLAAAVDTAGREGYRARVLVRYPLRSWPGLSERGLLLASREGSGQPRESQTAIGTSRNVETVARTVAEATSRGFEVDLLFSGSRDGSRTARRERLVVVLSRDAGSVTAADAVRVEQTTSFGTYGRGIPLGIAPFWGDGYVYAWAPAPRRQTWGSPIRLTNDEASCSGLDLKLRIDAPRDHTWSIVGLAARALPTSGYELVYVTDQRLGG